MSDAAQLEHNAESFKTLVQSNPFGMLVIDAGFRLQVFSAGANPVFSTVDDPIGRDFADILRQIWTEPFASEAIGRFRTTLATGEPYLNPNTVELRANIEAVEAYDWRIERIPLPDGTNGVVAHFYDLSERTRLDEALRHAVAQKELLAREIEHRVQNSLAIVAGLLTMQRMSATAPEARDALSAASLRVQAIGRVHHQLYQGDDVGVVEFGAYLRQLCRDVEQTIGHENLLCVFKADTVDLPVDVAVKLGIIANELLTNASKYGDPLAEQQISITLAVQPDVLVLTITDTGPGMPDDFSPNRDTGLGLKVIKMLVTDVEGAVEFPKAGGEARFEIRVPIAQG